MRPSRTLLLALAFIGTLSAPAWAAAPTLAGVEPAPLTYTENAGDKFVTASLIVADVDSPTLASGTVSISTNFVSTEDRLGFVNSGGMGNIAGSFDSFTGVLSLTSAGQTATALEWQSALRVVTYINLSENPSTLSRGIRFIVNDGTADSNAVTRTIDVVAVNDAPVLSTIEGTALTANENIPATITNNITIADVDSPNLTGATIQITMGYVNSQDTLTFTNTANITGTFVAATGTLTLTGSDTRANYQTALRAVRFLNNNDNLTPGSRTVEFRVNDGGTVFNLSNIVSRAVNVVAVNDAPAFANLELAPLSYTEGAAAAPITSTLTVSDIDNITLFTATVSLTVFAAGQDSLAFVNVPATMGNITGSISGVTGELGLTLTSAGATATLAQWQEALRAVTYSNASDNPSASRTLKFVIFDGLAFSTVVQRNITITPVNDAPTLSAVEGTALQYSDSPFSYKTTAGTAQLPITSTLNIGELDNTTLALATVCITGQYHPNQDVISFVNVPATMGNITGTFASGTATLISAGATATLTQWRTALQAVTYSNTSETPSTLQRTVRFIVNDGGLDSIPQTRNIDIVPLNDAPSFTKGPDQLVAQNSGPKIVAGWATNIAAGPVTLDEVGQTLMFSITGNTNLGLFAAGPAVDPTGQLTFTPAAATSGTATITLVLQDNGLNGNGHNNTSPAQTFVITVNDAPTLSAIELAPLTFVENGADLFITASLIVADSDSLTLAGGIVTLVNFAAGDVLNFTNVPASMGNIAGSYSTSTGVLTMVSAGATATLAQWQTALRAVSYINTSDNPSTTPRMVTFAVAGGGGISNTVSRTINITAVNDVPTLALAGAQSTSEDTNLTIAGISVGDLDVVTSIRFSVNATLGTVTLNTTTSLVVFSGGSGTSSMTYTGPVARVSAALSSIVYRGNADANGSDSIFVNIDDDGGSGAGGALTAAGSIAVTIAAVNDAPSFIKGADQTVAENSGAQSVAGWATSISAGPANESGQTLAFSVANDNSALFTTPPAVSAVGTLTYTVATGASGVANITLTLQDNGGGTNTSAPQTFKITVPRSTPLFSSTPTAAPNPAGTGQTVTFTAAATDPEGGAIVYTWTFGDGATATGAAVQHAYTVAGFYLVTVTATDAQGLRVAASLNVAVGAPLVGGGGIDSDNDGFSDAFEIAAGTSPTDPNSTPTGSKAGPPDETFFQSLKIGLNFSKPGNDTIAFGGAVPFPAGNFPFAGQKAVIDIGGAIMVFTLDEKAKSLPKGFTLRMDAPFRQYKFTLKTKGSFAAALADNGLVDATVKQSVNVPVLMVFAKRIYAKTLTLTYTGRAGRTGRTK